VGIASIQADDGKDGIALRDADGKLRWQPVVSFADKRVRDK
jgi:hypothetical protein